MTTSLPPEIWAIIIEMAILAGVCPRDAYTTSFSYQPMKGPRMNDRTWSTLRSVSRQFKALAGPSPFFAMKERHEAIPREIIAISIDSIHPNFRQLLDGTSPNSHHLHLVALKILYNHYHYDQRTRVQASSLFSPSTYLPNLQSLSLIRPNLTEGPLFWENLNAACPSLVYLYVQQDNVAAASPNVTVLQRLEVLAIPSRPPSQSVEFPALKHLTLGGFRSVDVKQVARWKNLETLLLQWIDEADLRWDWALFPNLRLLGIRVSHLYIVKSCPRDHHIRDFHIFNRGPSSGRIIVTLEHAPAGRSGILAPASPILSILSESPSVDALKYLSDKCDELGMEIVGVTSHPLWKRVRYMKPFIFSAASHLWRFVLYTTTYVPFGRQIWMMLTRVVVVIGCIVCFPAGFAIALAWRNR